MKKIKKFILIILIIAILSGCSGSLQNDKNPEEENHLAVSVAKYPEMPAYPKEADYFDRKAGTFDDESFSKDYDIWQAAKTKQNEHALAYQGNYADYYTAMTSEILLSHIEENVVYSPISLYIALAMLAETTASESQEQILNVLFEDNLENLRANTNHLWQAEYSADQLTTCLAANSLWLNQDLQFQKSTISALTNHYYASVFQGEMGSASFNKQMQNWLNQQTGNILEEYVNDLEFSDQMIMGLISTILFKDNWQDEFLESQNSKAVFYGKRNESEVDFMNQTVNDVYYRADNFSAISKSLASGADMWFILPDKESNIEQVLQNPQFYKLTGSGVAKNWQNKKEISINFSVPKFDIKANYQLNAHLKNLGISDVFSIAEANFEPLLENRDIPVILSKCLQGSRVMIDEKGVTAASYTVIELEKAAMPLQEKIDFILDRPFIFVINGMAGHPLFVGIVNQL